MMIAPRKLRTGSPGGRFRGGFQKPSHRLTPFRTPSESGHAAHAPHYRPAMTDMLIYDFIEDRDDERPPRVGGVTGWEVVIFELMDDEEDG